MSCNFDAIKGEYDKNILDINLISSKTVYENGEIVEITSEIINYTKIIPIYYWYIDNKYVPGQITGSFISPISHNNRTDKNYTITLKIKAAKWIAYKSINVTVKNNITANFDILIDNEALCEAIFYIGEPAKFTAKILNSADGDFKCRWKINNVYQSSHDKTFLYTPSRAGKFIITAEIENRGTVVDKSVTIYVIKNDESKILIKQKNLDDVIIMEFGKSEIIDIALRYPGGAQKKIEWFLKDTSNNLDFTKVNMSDVGKFIFPNEYMKPTEDKKYILKVILTVNNFVTEDSVVVIIRGNKPPVLSANLQKASWTYFEVLNNFAKIVIDANDENGDILYYSYKIDTGAIINLEENNFFILDSNLNIGNHTVKIFVTDKNYDAIQKEYPFEIKDSTFVQLFKYENQGSYTIDLKYSQEKEIYFIWTNCKDRQSANSTQFSKPKNEDNLTPRSLLNYVVGDKKKFYIVNYNESIYSPFEYQSTLRYRSALIDTKNGGKFLEIWVADNCFVGGDKPKLITQDMVNSLATKILVDGYGNDIYDYTTDIFGAEWSSNAKRIDANLLAEQNTIAVLLCDIHNDNKINIDTGATLGLFEKADTYSKAKLEITYPFEYSFSKPHSDDMLVVNLDALLYVDNSELILSTFVHEFTHLITYHNKEALNQQKSERWLEEMVSMVAEDIISDKLGIVGPSGKKVGNMSTGIELGRIPFYNAQPFNRVDSNIWIGESSYFNYGTVFSFGSYIIRNYRNEKLLKNILQNRKNGFDAILDGLLKSGYDVNLKDLFSNWGLSIVLSDVTDLPTNLEINSNCVDGFTYGEHRLTTINYFDYNYEGIAGPRFATENSQFIKPYSNYIVKYKTSSGEFKRNFIVPADLILNVAVK